MAQHHGKNYRAAAEKISRDQLYTPLQAANLVKELATAKFDETIEVHFRLGIDTRKADQNIRGFHLPAPRHRQDRPRRRLRRGREGSRG